MLSKELCKKCQDTYTQASIPYHREHFEKYFETMWNCGFTSCPLLEYKYIYTDTAKKNIPSSCPYILEHILLVGNGANK